MTEKANIVRILKVENIVIERDRYNYTVSELQKAKKGANAGELVQRMHTYHPSLETALMNVRERIRGAEYSKMNKDDLSSLIGSLAVADRKIKDVIKEIVGKCDI